IIFSNLIYNNKDKNLSYIYNIRLSLLIISIVIPLSYWSYITGQISMIGYQIEKIISLDFQARPILGQFLQGSLINQIITTSGLILFFCLGIIGSFWLINNNKKFIQFFFGFLCISLALLTFLATFTQILPLEHRWFYVSEIFIALPSIIGILLISKKRIVLMFIILLLIILLLINPVGSMDIILTSDSNKVQMALLDSEKIGWKFGKQISNSKILGDSYIMYVDNPLNFSNNNVIDNYIINYNITMIEYQNIFLRNQIINKPSRLSNKIVNIDYNPNILLNMNFSFSNYYSSKNINIYQKLN
ncbi:MAG: hypothetical protein QW520_00005, partial [Methanomassiliicoccales archaeon]